MTLSYPWLLLLIMITTFSIAHPQAEFEIEKAPEQEQDSLNQSKPLPKIESKTEPEKEWNFIIYMIGNGLYNIALENLKEMLVIGSTPYCNILVQIDHAGQSSATRFFIEKDKAILQPLEDESSGLLRGTPASLFFFIKWATKKYPSKHQALVLWNHASGIKHPNIWEKIYKENRDQLFQINPETGLLELNRTGVIKHNSEIAPDHEESSQFRNWGSSFNQPSEVFINEQELHQCLLGAKDLLRGKNVDLIIFDACHLAMLEMSSICRESAQFMIASQEIIPGSGCNFTKIFEPFTQRTMSSRMLARHIVQTFEDEYASSFADFSLSALNLQDSDIVENLISHLAELLLARLKQDCGFYYFINKIRESSSLTIEFFDKDYIDLYHFLNSFLSEYQKQIESSNDQTFVDFKNTITSILRLLDQRIIAKTNGLNLKKARGLSIYFPKRSIHSSYLKTSGLKGNFWTEFLSMYIRTGREL